MDDRQSEPRASDRKLQETDIRVAKVLGRYDLVVNRGTNAGIEEGQKFVVYEPGEEVVDPLTGESLGNIEIVKTVGTVINVQEKMAILHTEKPREPHSVRTLNEMIRSATSTAAIIGGAAALLESSDRDVYDKKVEDVKVGDRVKLVRYS